MVNLLVEAAPQHRALLDAAPPTTEWATLAATGAQVLPLFPFFLMAPGRPAPGCPRLDAGALALPWHPSRAARSVGPRHRPGCTGGAAPAACAVGMPAHRCAVPAPQPAGRCGGAHLGPLSLEVRSDMFFCVFVAFLVVPLYSRAVEPLSDPCMPPPRFHVNNSSWTHNGSLAGAGGAGRGARRSGRHAAAPPSHDAGKKHRHQFCASICALLASGLASASACLRSERCRRCRRRPNLAPSGSTSACRPLTDSPELRPSVACGPAHAHAQALPLTAQAMEAPSSSSTASPLPGEASNVRAAIGGGGGGGLSWLAERWCAAGRRAVGTTSSWRWIRPSSMPPRASQQSPRRPIPNPTGRAGGQSIAGC